MRVIGRKSLRKFKYAVFDSHSRNDRGKIVPYGAVVLLGFQNLADLISNISSTYGRGSPFKALSLSLEQISCEPLFSAMSSEVVQSKRRRVTEAVEPQPHEKVFLSFCHYFLRLFRWDLNLSVSCVTDFYSNALSSP